MPKMGLMNNVSSFTSASAGVSRSSVSVSNSYHVTFDGTDDYIQVPSTLGSVIAPGSSWSVTAWIKYDDSGSGEDAIIASGDSSSRFFIRFTNSSGRLRVTADGGSTTKLYTSGNITEDEWNHIAIVYTYDDTNELVYYRNGSAVGSASNFNMSGAPANDNAQIGVRADTLDDYLGRIAMLGVFSKALSASEVSDIYGTPGYVLTDISDCELWYRMGDGTEDGSGSKVYDMSGNSLLGDLQNDAAIASGGVD
jgi:hypothetical protein